MNAPKQNHPPPNPGPSSQALNSLAPHKADIYVSIYTPPVYIKDLHYHWVFCMYSRSSYVWRNVHMIPRASGCQYQIWKGDPTTGRDYLFQVPLGQIKESDWDGLIALAKQLKTPNDDVDCTPQVWVLRLWEEVFKSGAITKETWEVGGDRLLPFYGPSLKLRDKVKQRDAKCEEKELTGISGQEKADDRSSGV